MILTALLGVILKSWRAAPLVALNKRRRQRRLRGRFGDYQEEPMASPGSASDGPFNTEKKSQNPSKPHFVHLINEGIAQVPGSRALIPSVPVRPFAVIEKHSCGQ